MGFDNIRLKEAYWILEHFSAMLVDVREKEKYDQYHLRNAHNIPYDEFEKYHFQKEVIYIVYCQNGIQSMRAARDLAMNGYRVYNLLGGLSGSDKDIDM